MAGFVLLTLIYFTTIMAAWYAALVGGMFLARAGFRQPFGDNPGYVMLTLAVLLGFLVAIVNPSVLLGFYLGFGSAARAIFTGFVGALIGLSIVAAVGYLLSPERVSKYYDRTQGWMNDGKAMFVQAESGNQGVSRDKPEPRPASEGQKLDGNVNARNDQNAEQGSGRARDNPDRRGIEPEL